ncbi:protein phosphatase regulator [Sorochytrium milnesiophthora]
MTTSRLTSTLRGTKAATAQTATVTLRLPALKRQHHAMSTTQSGSGAAVSRIRDKLDDIVEARATAACSMYAAQLDRVAHETSEYTHAAVASLMDALGGEAVTCHKRTLDQLEQMELQLVKRIRLRVHAFVTTCTEAQKSITAVDTASHQTAQDFDQQAQQLESAQAAQQRQLLEELRQDQLQPPMDRDALVQQFVGVTGGTKQQAAFFLDAHNNDVQAAVGAFYEQEGGATDMAPHSEVSASASMGAGASSSPIPTASSSSSSAPKSRIAGFSDVTSAGANSKEQDNTYFAGGGKNSGIALQGPGGEKKPASLVQDILNLASQNGPRPPGEAGEDDDEEMDEERDETAAERSRRLAFTGAGFRLGSEEEPASSQPSRPVVNSQPSAGAPSSRSLPKVTRTITFWKNGFSIEDGPLRSYDDPESQQILQALKSGYVLQTLAVHILNVQFGQPVDVKVAHKLEEEYKPPPMKPFSGSGQRLGSVVPAVVNNSSLPGAFSGSSASPAETAAPVPALSVDENKPMTTLQIRLGDGTRLVSKFNHDHTVGDIRSFINSARPGQASRQYILQTTFPNRELTDSKATIKDAGLLSAVVVQRYV